MSWTNKFEGKTNDELAKLYSQFLKAEKSGNFERDTELGKIKAKYEAEFAS